MTGVLRVSVVAGERRSDLAVPAALPVAELVPGLARRLAVAPGAGLRLCSLDGTVLADSDGLARQGVADGSVLTLVPEPPPPPVLDDPVEALGSVLPSGPPAGPLPARVLSDAVVAAVAGLLLGLGAAALAAAHQPRACAAAALVLAAVALTRRTGGQVALAGTAAAGYAALAAAQLVGRWRPGPGASWSAAAGAGLAVTAVLMAGLARHRLRLLPTVVLGLAAAAYGAGLALSAAPARVLAPVLLVVATAAGAALPWLAVEPVAAGSRRAGARIDPGALEQDARVGRHLLRGIALGLAVVQLALVPLVVAGGPSGTVLAAGLGGVTTLRARHHGPAAGVLGAVGGPACLLAAAVTALWLHPSWRPAGGGLSAAAGCLLVVLDAARGVEASPLGGLAVRVADALCLAAVVPALAVATDASAVLR